MKSADTTAATTVGPMANQKVEQKAVASAGRSVDLTALWRVDSKAAR